MLDARVRGMSMEEKLEGFETVRYRQRYRVQEDFGDGQIACAMMTMVFPAGASDLWR